MVQEVCDAIVRNIGKTFLKVPSSMEEWITIADLFDETWQYHNCLGAIVGKHIVMQPHRNAGSHYYNYKIGRAHV